MKYKFEDLRITGWKKWTHKTFMFITYPFRKPIFFLVLLLALFLTPVFVAKVAPKYVHLWYKEQIISNYLKAKEFVLGNIDFDKLTKTETKGTDKIVSVPQPQVHSVRRQGFGRSEEVEARQQQEVIDSNLDVVEDIVFEDGTTETPDEENIATAKMPDFSDSDDEAVAVVSTTVSGDDIPSRQTKQDFVGKAKIKKNLPLKYIVSPEEVTGVVKVINSNSIEVDGKFMFLYGIYSNPAGEDGKKAEKLLRDNIEGKVITCQIVAYTYQDAPTAMCYAGNKSINHTLVNRGYAKNVALD